MKDWDALLLEAARDESALVRAEAIKAAVDLQGATAVEAFFEVANRPLDPELETVLAYAKPRLNVDEQLKRSIDNNVKLSEAALQYAFQNASVESILKLPKSEKAYQSILARPSVSIDNLRIA